MYSGMVRKIWLKLVQKPDMTSRKRAKRQLLQCMRFKSGLRRAPPSKPGRPLPLGRTRSQRTLRTSQVPMKIWHSNQPKASQRKPGIIRATRTTKTVMKKRRLPSTSTASSMTLRKVRAPAEPASVVGSL